MQYYQMTGFMGATDTLPDEDEAVIDLPAPDKSVLLLDFDGTLVEIAETPDGINVTPEVKALLAKAMDRLDGRVALVSGRSVETLERFLPDFKGTLIGTHGAEMRHDGELRDLVEIDRDAVARLCRLVDDMGGLRPEFVVEHKPSGVVLHYRQAEEHGAIALRFMESLAMAADGFKLQAALMAYEIKPEGVGKDIALEGLLSKPQFEGFTPVFAGDDLTDEPALDLVQMRGGCGIKIGEAETVAHHRLHDPATLLVHLDRWLA